MWLSLVLAAAAAAELPPMSLPAAAYVPRTIAGWTVAASADESGCFLTRDYADQGGTTLLLGLDNAGANRLTLLNPDWSIKRRAQVVLDFRLSKGAYPQHAAIGIESNGKQGFVTDFETGFPGHFASSGFLHVQRGTVPVAQLSLAGSGAAIAELRRCVALQRAQAAGGSPGRQHSERIPRDPFAPGFDRRDRKK